MRLGPIIVWRSNLDIIPNLRNCDLFNIL